ncbi:SurA N-terminal domain-containing protein [Albimonas sp. CAU 1670]|uniref:peptidylprolyl isomerase n=1 Tax=Albimonas sp. CAU 1670 TaxID=3032599 RepID=UPI0023DB7B9F|nr:peptidylprolyl isomerase [Albimonas sp. CAU 1670]MDF2234235.1 SurA N-terminal domain-containing protein [Albimonas sp. CAU 1670]
MLHLLRRASKTWAFRILFGVLVVSFAVWGVGDLDLGGAGTPVASVGEEKVTVEDFANGLIREMQSVSRRTGQPVDRAQAEAMGLPQSLLGRMVRDAALNEEARRLGISADDHALREAILESPSFQGLDGTFDEDQYRFVLDRLGFRVDRFEDDLRKSLAREAVARGVRGGAVAAPGLAADLAAYGLERRVFAAIDLPLAGAPDPGQPSESDLAAWHEAHADAYQWPERRDAAWLEISPEALAETVEIPEERLRAAYEAAGARYAIPERRAVDRLVFPDEASARAAVDAIASGESDFEAEVEKRGLSPADVDEGEVTRDDYDDATAEAIFSADLGVVGPLPSSLGPALYNVRASIPARVTPFEDAREELRRQLARDEARELAHQRAEEAADLLASGETLEKIAQETGLPLREKTGLTRDGMAEAAGVEGSPELIEEVFAAEPGEERDLVETYGGAWALVRVDAVTPSAPQTLEEARAQVAADWADARRREALTEMAEAARARLDAGEPLDAVAADLPGSLVRSRPLRRDEEDAGIPAAAREALSRAEAGTAAVAPSADGVALVQLVEVMPADLEDGQGAELVGRWRDALDEAVANDLYVYYAAALQERLAPQYNPQAMDRAINSIR